MPGVSFARFTAKPRSSTALPNADYGPDLRDWMKVAATNTEVKANGGKLYLPTTRTYYAGDCGDMRSSAFIHSLDTGLANNGWLTLDGWLGRPQVDLSPTATGISLTDLTKGGALKMGDLNTAFGNVSLRTAFLNMDFQNGEVYGGGIDRIRFGNCTGYYPFATFKSHYDAACTQEGVSVVTDPPNDSTYNDVLDNSDYLKGNHQATPFRFEQGSGPQRPQRVWLYAVDSKASGDDGLYMGNTSHLKVVGCRVWNNFGGSHGGTSALFQARFHNDALQGTGSFDDWAVTDSLLCAHIQIGTEFGGITSLTFDDVWQCNSDGGGMSLSDGSDVTGHIGSAGHPYKWFGNGQVFGPTDVGGDYATPVGWNMGIVPTGSLTIAGSLNINHTVPSGVTFTGGVLDDVVGQVVNNVNNPALLWRAANTSVETVWSGTYD